MPRLSRFVFAFVLLAALMPQFARAQAPSITIDTPQQSEIVGAGSVFVAGSGTALFENNVVIQALDYSGIVLGETAATVDAELGGSGPWSAQLILRVPPGTPGRIYVFSKSPADGAIIADATVDVMFGEAPLPPTDTPEPPPTDTATPTTTPEPPPTNTATATATSEPPPTNTATATATSEPPPTNTATATATREPPPVSVEITIRIPIPGEIVSNRQIVVSGTGSGLPENTVVVQALDTRGRIIAQRPTTVEAPLGSFGPWRVTLDYNVPAGTPGYIYAFAQSPADGSIMAEATVPVTFGQYMPPTATFTPAPPTPRPPTATPTRIAPPTPMPLPFIAIDSPRSGEVVSPIEVFVTGSGVALPENNVVVQALDSGGRIVGQRATTVDAPLGGSGRWSTVVRLNVRSGTSGRIYAFAPSPADGRVIADASIAVRFGAPPPPTPTPTPIAAPSIRIERPANGASIDASRPFAISGIGTNLFENNVVVRIRDAFGRTLRQIATTADRNGRWAVTAEVRVPSGSTGSIYAFSTSPATGAVVADDLVQVTFIASCQVRTDWPVYIVQPGDTLTWIAQNTGSTVAELVQANCLAEPAVIYVGQPLHVPRLPGVTPPVIATPALAIIAPEVNAELTPNTRFIVTGEAAGVAPDLVFAVCSMRTAP
ncbi:MAG: LysM peptidoglycan-binding domain-containing protein [Anaerolineales bacterium]|nr:LysM peptidoglycan-binding domain-containing protein [Anaerolineales bacterium]